MQLPTAKPNIKSNLAFAGFVFGLCFPLVGTLIEMGRIGELSFAGFWQVQVATPLLWIIDTAPLFLGLAGRLAAPNYKVLPRAEKQILPLLVSGLFVPLILLVCALNIESRATRIVDDIALCDSLGKQSLYLYAITDKANSDEAWHPHWQRSDSALIELKEKYPEEMMVLEPYWKTITEQLRQNGKIKWADVIRMSQSAEAVTEEIEDHQLHNQNVLIAVFTIGFLCLLLGFAKSYELLQQIQAARHSLEESEHRFEKLTAASFEGITLSQNGFIVAANPQMCEMFGYTPSEFVGLPGELLVAEDQREIVYQKIHLQIEDPYESVGLRKNGQTFPIEVEGKTVQYNGVLARVTAVRDLSERKRIESELRAANQRLSHLVNVDELTGLCNRRAFNERLNSEFERSIRYEIPLSLLMLDIDRFKVINDTWGHGYGDIVLQGIAVLLQKTIRPCDTLARYGGEELAVVLPNTYGEGAYLLAERCREAIESSVWPHQKVTASFGVSTLTANSIITNPDELVKLADNALYYSKQQGRNRVSHVDLIPSAGKK